ncbi:helix-turn-helix domain-containing protein [Acidicapsa dinghuensis]|uniref:Helix-turn-helix domain-containing protein n=1 Tax=Acidicapsa dinghuensis TaxID=2218256 RepID=A0ABW1EJ01_9BACT|nr:helix-turn-helix transcriptional regulator [Acidicapsa dinghuensis]
MSLLSKRGLLKRIRRSKEARSRLVESNLAKRVAYQIRATREAQDLSQSALADAVGMSQNNISRLENPDYGKHTISSLRRIADALDVALVVNFVPFSQFVDWLSGTPYLDKGLRPEALAVPKFAEEEQQKAFDSDIKYYGVFTNPVAASGVYPSRIEISTPPIPLFQSAGAITPPINSGSSRPMLSESQRVKQEWAA